MLLSPFTGNRLITGFVGFVDVSDLGNKRVIGVGVTQQRTNRKKELRDSQRRAPFVLQDIQTNTTVGVDVGMIDLCGKVDLGGFEGIVGGEVDVQKENTTFEWALLRAHNCGCPVKKIITSGSGRARHGRVLLEVLQFFVNSFQCLLSRHVFFCGCCGERGRGGGGVQGGRVEFSEQESHQEKKKDSKAYYLTLNVDVFVYTPQGKISENH